MELEWKMQQGRRFAEDALVVRNAVFVDEQGFGADIEVDEYDDTAWHLSGSFEGRPVCAGRLFTENGAAPGTMHIGRVCVLRELRGKGLGAGVMVRLCDKAAELGASRVQLGAQTHARGFYEGLGFHAVGEEFLEEGKPHILMEKDL